MQRLRLDTYGDHSTSCFERLALALVADQVTSLVEMSLRHGDLFRTESWLSPMIAGRRRSLESALYLKCVLI